MEKNLTKLLEIFKGIDTFKSGINATIVETTENPDIKMDFLIMNISPKFIFILTELKEILVNHNDNIVITTLPIGKYNDKIFMCDKGYSKDEIIELIQTHNKKIIIYGEINNPNYTFPLKYQCAIID